jgi:hypothetical protein
MIYCSKCGQKMKEGTRFCRTCGTPTGIAPPPLPPVASSASAPVYEAYAVSRRGGLTTAILARIAVGLVLIVFGGVAAWQIGVFEKSQGVGDAPAEAAPLDETAAWKASYDDDFVSDNQTLYLTAEANLRDYPSSDGTAVLRSLPQGSPVSGRMVRGREKDQQWLKLDEGGYIWDGNVGESTSIYPSGMAGLFVGSDFSPFAGSGFSDDGVYGANAESVPACEIYNSYDGQLSVMFENGVATSFNTGSAAFLTQKGVRVGMTIDQLKAAYGDALEIETNPYEGTDYYVWQTPERGLRFWVGGSGRIETIWSGTQSIRYIEGCS